MIRSMIHLIGSIFKKKQEKDITIHDNRTSVRIEEIRSEDSVVRRFKYTVALIILLALLFEFLGFRVALMIKYGLDYNTITSEKLLDVLSRVFVELISL